MSTFKRKDYNTTKNETNLQTPIQSFHKTFKIITFSMAAGMLYPNPDTDRFRLIAILLTYATVVPVSVMILADMHLSWQTGAIENIIRHCTVLIPFFVALTKMGVMYYQKANAKKIIDEIDRDHQQFNFLPDSYKKYVYKHLEENKYAEKRWLAIIIHCVVVFPVMASVQNLHSFLFTSEQKKYMVHDLKWPLLPNEKRLESPYFEIMFAYMVYCCVIYLFNFVGYDGFFGIAINRACLKMRLYCYALEDAFKLGSEEDILEGMRGVIRSQWRVQRYIKTIQETFNIWLGIIYVATIVHVCNCMYQIVEGSSIDLRYLIFIIGSVIHIYLPCSHATSLRSVAEETAILIYCSGWERAEYRRVRNMVVFMLARAQHPTVVTAFNVIAIDMKMFVSILRTSYSMFTLLRK